MVNSQDIMAILSGEDSLEEKGAKLIAAANQNGGKDNITVVLVENYKTAQQQPATRPAGVTEKQPSMPVKEQTRPAEPTPATVKAAPETKLTEPVREVQSKQGLVRFLTLASLFLLATTLILAWLYLRPEGVKAETATSVDPIFRRGPGRTGSKAAGSHQCPEGRYPADLGG